MPPELIELFAGTSIFIIFAVCGGTVLSLALTIGVTVFAIRYIRKMVGPNRSILQNGVPAQARIMAVQQTGMMVNHQPQIVFDLEVRSPGGSPYRAQTKAVIPVVNIPQLQPGVEVPVKIHPTDPAQVVLDIYR